MAATGTDIFTALRKGPPGPLYYIYGKEPYLVDRVVEMIRQAVLQPATRDFNYELFQGKEADPARIVQAAKTLPMMAPRRLVLVRDADELSAATLELFLPYLAAPCKETCLVFVAEKIDQRLKFFQTWKKQGGELCKLDPLYDRELPGFVRSEAVARKITFAAGAAEFLCEEVGAELSRLADAIERLALYVGDRTQVTAEDVEAVVASSRQRNVFELANAIGEGKRGEALRVLSVMMDNNESGVKIVAMIARHVRQLWQAKELLDGGARRSELASALGVPPFFVDAIERQAQKLGDGVAQSWLTLLLASDRDLKSSKLSDDRLLEQLILSMTTSAKAAA